MRWRKSRAAATRTGSSARSRCSAQKSSATRCSRSCGSTLRRAEVERLYSSNAAVYPVGGRKRKKDTAWARHVLGAMQVFRATERGAIREAFDDHETIFGLGIGAMLNVPIAFAGRCLGTMNLSNVEGWFTADDERTGLLLGAFITPALLHAVVPAKAGTQ